MFMNVTFANGVTKLVFEPPDKKGTFLLVDTFKSVSAEPTRTTRVGDNEYKFFEAELCGFNSILNEFADENSPRKIFVTEDYAKKIRPIKVDGAKFARYIPLQDNDTRKHQLDVACGYVEDKFYHVKKISDGFRPVYVVERDFHCSILKVAQSRQQEQAFKVPFKFAQVDLQGWMDECEEHDGWNELTRKDILRQPIIYEPVNQSYGNERFYHVVPVQDFGWNDDGVYQEIYFNGELYKNFPKQKLRWSKFLGLVFYSVIEDMRRPSIDDTDYLYLFWQLMLMRGRGNVKDYLRIEKRLQSIDQSMSDAELLGYAGDYYSDDLWDLNGF